MKKFAMACIFSCLLLTLTACSQANSRNDASKQQISAPLENDASQATGENETMQTLKALSAPKGLNTKRLFAQPLDNSDLRFARLEREVQRLRDDFDLVSPSITRLVAVEQDMRDLMAQLETLVQAEDGNDVIMMDDQMMSSSAGDETMPMALNNNAPMPNTVQSVLDQAKAEAQSGTANNTNTPQQAGAQNVNQSPPPAQTASLNSTVQAVRLGEHSDKTRIVMDLTNKTQYTAQLLDNGTKLEVMFPRSGWSGQRSWSSNTSPLINNYAVTTLPQGGHKVMFNLNGVATMETNSIFPPVANKSHRLVIDLVNPNIHTQ